MEETEYLVIRIKDVNGKKKLICLNEESASFQLYNTELVRYGICEGGCISAEVYSIIRDKLVNRARKRALHIVTKQDITENVLRAKLADSGYGTDIIDLTVSFMEEHGFINDKRYAANYVWCKADTRSRRQIEAYLYNKGIIREIIDRVCDEYYLSNEDAENTLIKKLIEKKRADVRSMTYEERAKLTSYLVRRGFEFDSVSRVIDDMRQQ